MATFVGVKLKSDSQKAYWFSVPEELSPDIRMGCDVICTTVRGTMEGIIRNVILLKISIEYIIALMML